MMLVINEHLANFLIENSQEVKKEKHMRVYIDPNPLRATVSEHQEKKEEKKVEWKTSKEQKRKDLEKNWWSQSNSNYTSYSSGQSYKSVFSIKDVDKFKFLNVENLTCSFYRVNNKSEIIFTFIYKKSYYELSKSVLHLIEHKDNKWSLNAYSLDQKLSNSLLENKYDYLYHSKEMNVPDLIKEVKKFLLYYSVSPTDFITQLFKAFEEPLLISGNEFTTVYQTANVVDKDNKPTNYTYSSNNYHNYNGHYYQGWD